MHKKRPNICTGCRVNAAKIYLYHTPKIAKARPHSVEWQTDSSVQKQRFMSDVIALQCVVELLYQGSLGRSILIKNLS
jgi:hypothetical protein